MPDVGARGPDGTPPEVPAAGGVSPGAVIPDGRSPGSTTPEVSREWATIDGTAYRRVVLCFLFRPSPTGREVLLGLKRTGFGTGRVVALGGKVDGDESDLDAAVREVEEESGIVLPPSGLRYAGRISWSFPATPGWNMQSALFTAEAGRSVPVPCEEIEPRWYPVDAIPWAAMWKDAPHWLPQLLAGTRIDAHIEMAADNDGVARATIS